ncbi:MAG: hypothetical protein EXQ52_10390 [Bryobacterales bacterium]|nr:hypothetical protein [Bryobacterales bacterium]
MVGTIAVTIQNDEEPVTDEDRCHFTTGKLCFGEREGEGIPMEDVLAGFGLKTGNFPLKK